MTRRERVLLYGYILILAGLLYLSHRVIEDEKQLEKYQSGVCVWTEKKK